MTLFIVPFTIKRQYICLFNMLELPSQVPFVLNFEFTFGGCSQLEGDTSPSFPSLFKVHFKSKTQPDYIHIVLGPRLYKSIILYRFSHNYHWPLTHMRVWLQLLYIYRSLILFVFKSLGFFILEKLASQFCPNSTDKELFFEKDVQC